MTALSERGLRRVSGPRSGPGRAFAATRVVDHVLVGDKIVVGLCARPVRYLEDHGAFPCDEDYREGVRACTIAFVASSLTTDSMSSTRCGMS